MKHFALWTTALAVTVTLLAARLAAADSTDTSAAKAEPPKHALAAANDEQKKLYDGVKKTLSAYGPRDVVSRVRSNGFGGKIGTYFSPILESTLWAYCYSGDTAWLDRFVALMSELEKQLATDPDGQLGWYSNFDNQRTGVIWPPNWPDDLLTAQQAAEARLGAVCLDFALTVQNEPELKAKYGDQAEKWATLVEQQLMPKWEGKYGCLLGLSDDRAVFCWPMKAFRKSTMAWEPFVGLPSENDNLTLPHPAQSEIIREYLKAWQHSGKVEYRTTAARLLRWQRSCLRPGRNGSVWWNYWDPASDHDFFPVGGLAFGMWVHPLASYCGRDVEAFVEAYHTGTIIDKSDIEHLVNTQTKVMLAGTPDKPSWVGIQGKGAGMLWPPLAEFDDTLRTRFTANPNPQDLEFGGPLRIFQEQLQWKEGQRRKVGADGLVSWNKTFEDYKKGLDELIRLHPPPDPRAQMQKKTVPAK